MYSFKGYSERYNNKLDLDIDWIVDSFMKRYTELVKHMFQHNIYGHSVKTLPTSLVPIENTKYTFLQHSNINRKIQIVFVSLF